MCNNICESVTLLAICYLFAKFILDELKVTRYHRYSEAKYDVLLNETRHRIG
jgi:hypothetical protein